MNLVVVTIALQEIAVTFSGLLHVVLALRLLELRRGCLLEGVQALVAINRYILRASAKALRIAIVIGQDGVKLVLARLVLRRRPEAHFLHNSQLLVPLRFRRHLHHSAEELFARHGRRVATSLQLIVLLVQDIVVPLVQLVRLDLRHLRFLFRVDALHPILIQSHFLRALLMCLYAGLLIAAREVRRVVFDFASIQVRVPSRLKLLLLPVRSLLGRHQICLTVSALALREYIGKDESAFRRATLRLSRLRILPIGVWAALQVVGRPAIVLLGALALLSVLAEIRTRLGGLSHLGSVPVARRL